MTSFTTSTMASGHLYLELSDTMAWADFPSYAEELAASLGASLGKRVDAIDMRVWELQTPGATLRLVYDDFPISVSIESDDDAGDRFLIALASRLNATSL